MIGGYRFFTLWGTMIRSTADPKYDREFFYSTNDFLGGVRLTF